MTNQTRAVAYRNTYIAAEWGKNGKLSDNTEATRIEAAKRFRRKKESEANKTRRRNQAKYNGAKNTCPECHTQKAVLTGECLCD